MSASYCRLCPYPDPNVQTSKRVDCFTNAGHPTICKILVVGGIKVCRPCVVIAPNPRLSPGLSQVFAHNPWDLRIGTEGASRERRETTATEPARQTNVRSGAPGAPGRQRGAKWNAGPAGLTSRMGWQKTKRRETAKKAAVSLQTDH